MTREEIRQDLEDGKYINSFKARRYIEFLLAACDDMEERAEREHGWAIAWAATAEELSNKIAGRKTQEG